MSTGKTKIFWSHDEKRLLAAEIALIQHSEPGTSHSAVLERAMHKLRSLVRTCDVAVWMTDFLPHSAGRLMAACSERFVRPAGGISKLKETLEGVLPHSTAQTEAGASQAK
jgi:hypothetical protein